MRLRALLVLTAMSPCLAEAQGAARPIPVGFTRDTVSRATTSDSSSPAARLLLLKPPTQDARGSSAACSSATCLLPADPDQTAERLRDRRSHLASLEAALVRFTTPTCVLARDSCQILLST